MTSLELWGGAECTVNRVGDVFGDQVAATGHCERFGDLDLIAGLGVAALRFPVLWERVSPERAEDRDFSWSDPRLERLREVGVRPIVGLVHHGSGPRYTSLLDDGFAQGLAAHALATAMRYPWVDEWTPVNEPLTTARFSALYGHWYPHACDERQFWIALLNQIDDTRLAMRAIRQVNPAARLIQTDDLGRTYATTVLADQAAFDNTRRWLSWDLLCGLVGPSHPFWERLCGYGLEARLRDIAESPCPPDVIGINHYLTSDRFLDHRVQRYPRQDQGSNGRTVFADVAAVRVLDPPPPGLAGALREAWERYRLPIAVTEVHNGCTREEQLRWFEEAWKTGEDARAEGIDVRAITAWGLFGSRGWNTLLTGEGIYEPGVFDVSGGTPRETALAKLMRGRARPSGRHPVLAGAGWWRKDMRLHHPVSRRPARWSEHARRAWALAGGGPPLLILGATGTLGGALAAACTHRDIPFVLTGRSELDLHDPTSIGGALDAHQPWAVVNAAGWVRVDDAEVEPEACLAANRDGAVALAQACAARGVPTLGFSSDMVFDGTKGQPHGEADEPAPRNVYGRSKAEMERLVGALAGDHLIVRTAAFFSPYDEANFAVHVARELKAGRRFQAAEDCAVSPTYVPHLCNAALDLLIDGEVGIWHLTNGEELSWAEFARRVAEASGLDKALIEPVPGNALGWRATRPRACGLISRRGSQMPSLQAALDDFVRHFDQSVASGHRRALASEGA